MVLDAGGWEVPKTARTVPVVYLARAPATLIGHTKGPFFLNPLFQPKKRRTSQEAETLPQAHAFRARIQNR